MSWVPSPSPRLTASYREVPIPMILGTVPNHGGRFPSRSPTGQQVQPSAPSFGQHQAPRENSQRRPQPTTRQGSSTPAHATVQANQVHGMNPGLAQLSIPNRLGSLNNIPYAAPALTPARELAFQNRSWTPLPNTSVLGGLERPKPSSRDDKLSHSLTMLPVDFTVPPPELLGSPAASPIADMRGFGLLGAGFANGDTNGSPAYAHGSADAGDRQFSHKPRQSSFTQAPVAINANIYYQRAIGFDDQGRAQRKIGGNELSWGAKMTKDIIGVYHVGIEVHGCEYTFGNYRAPGSRQVGGPGSGVYCHEPRRPGPHCVFKCPEPLGQTTSSPGQVEDICAAFGSSEWSKASYLLVHHNCVDFSRILSAKLGGSDIPAWCYRGAEIAKVIGLGGNANEDSEEYSQEQSLAVDESVFQVEEQVTFKPHMDTAMTASVRQVPQVQSLIDPGRLAAMDLATRSQSGTYVAPPPLPGPLPGSLAGTYVAPPVYVPGLNGTYVAPPMPPPSVAPAPAPAPAQSAPYAAGSRVNVLQSDGSWQSGSIVMERPRDGEDSTYTIMYDGTVSTEVNVSHHRLLPSSNPLQAAWTQPDSRSFDLGFKAPPVFQGLASADSIREPPKGLTHHTQNGFNQHSIPSHARGPSWGPSVSAKAHPLQQPVAPAGSFSMGGFRSGRPSGAAGPPPSAVSFGTGTSSAQSLRSLRPSTGSFNPPGGYPMTGARAPSGVPQSAVPRTNVVRGRDTLGGTIR